MQEPDRRAGDGGPALPFEALVHASPDFIAIAAVDGGVRFLNAAGRRLIGMPDDVDVSTTTIDDFLTPDGLRASREIEQPAVVRDGYWSGETTLRNWRDGTGIPVQVTSFLMADDTGQPVALATVQRDLREAHRARTAVAVADAAVRSSEARLRALLLHMSDLLLVVDREGTLVYASPSSNRLLGFDTDNRLGSQILDLVYEPDRAAAAAAFAADSERPGPGTPRPVRLVTADGRVLVFEAQANNLLADPDIQGIVISAHDVTAFHHTERLQRSQARVLEVIASGSELSVALRDVALWVEQQLDGVTCSILLTDRDKPGTVLRHGASPSLPALYRRTVDGMPIAGSASPCSLAVQRSEPVLIADLLSDGRWDALHELIAACQMRSWWSFPILSPTSGETLGAFALYRGEPGLPDDRIHSVISRASHLVGIAVDREWLLHHLAHQAHHDALTALPNRTQLLAVLQDVLARPTAPAAARPVVMFLDLDRLKVVNDSLGHDVGDELIVSIAERLRTALPPSDLLARFGGDEFVILSAAADESGVVALAETVLAVTSEPVQLEGRVLTPSASIGVVFAQFGQGATHVLRDADVAMYSAKRAGGGRFALFGPEMRHRAVDRLDLESQLRHGLDDEQFRLFYQPVVDLRDGGTIVGFEALVRWQHPERGLLLPSEFIALAEETGLILPLGEWVLRTAVDTARRWSLSIDTAGLSMSVNLAAQQLSSPGLVALVEECVAAVTPWSLGLELTESALMDEQSGALAVIEQLARTGARLSIDDFGTGFSSLSYLTRMPLRQLKIDRSFVTDLPTSTQAAAVAGAIIGLAEQLQMSALAEGIESEEQRRRLVEMGCRFGQGYLFSRPVPEDVALSQLQGRLLPIEASGG